MTSSIKPWRILCVVGARPNFMKIAPIMRAFAASPVFDARLVHTGQHYDAAMKASIFEQLEIPEPDVDLGVGSGSHAVQTAEIMRRFEPVLDALAPDAVLVVGDVNSTIACALVAAKRGVPVVHVEAGLRSFDRGMPEEINRVLTDQLADLLFTTEQHAEINLTREGVDPSRIRFVGNVMIDTLLQNRGRCPDVRQVLGTAGAGRCVDSSGYALVTLHRPSNVDDLATLRSLVGTLALVSERIPVVFPAHPRTRGRLEEAGLLEDVERRFILLPPLPYLDLLALLESARLVLTDSGGIQEETTALGVPCLTLRENTERPVTVTEGTNTVVGTDRQRVLACAEDILQSGGKRGQIPRFWDGHAAVRIRDELLVWLEQRPVVGSQGTLE